MKIEIRVVAQHTAKNNRLYRVNILKDGANIDHDTEWGGRFKVNGNKNNELNTVSIFSRNDASTFNFDENNIYELVRVSVLAAHRKWNDSELDENLKDYREKSGYVEFTHYDNLYTYITRDNVNMSAYTSKIDKMFKELTGEFKPDWEEHVKKSIVKNIKKLYNDADDERIKYYLTGMLSTITTDSLAANFLDSFVRLQDLSKE